MCPEVIMWWLVRRSSSIQQKLFHIAVKITKKEWNRCYVLLSYHSVQKATSSQKSYYDLWNALLSDITLPIASRKEVAQNSPISQVVVKWNLSNHNKILELPASWGECCFSTIVHSDISKPLGYGWRSGHRSVVPFSLYETSTLSLISSVCIG